MGQLLVQALLSASVLSLVAAKPMEFLPLTVGEAVPQEDAVKEHSVCWPAGVGSVKLNDFDYTANGGQKYVTVISTYYTGCNPGRQASPLYGQVAEAMVKSTAGKDIKPVFLAGLKGGVNDPVCADWATLNATNGEAPSTSQPWIVDDSSRALLYPFFEGSVHPVYVVLDHCMRVAGEFVGVDEDQFFEPTHMGKLQLKVLELLDSTEDCPERELAPAPAVETEPFVAGTCVPSLGAAGVARAVAVGTAHSLSSPRDLAFSPTTGELMVANQGTQTVTLLTADWEKVCAPRADAGNREIDQDLLVLTGDKAVTSLHRMDRAPYHYMANIASLAFAPNGYFATCHESENIYDGKDFANFFMGPTLYNGSEALLIHTDGTPCEGKDRDPSYGRPCFYTHDDMLHEAPLCMGIAHDPETVTPFRNVYWLNAAFYEPTDPLYDFETSTIIRMDFERPHRPGSLDHSLAAVRRHLDVVLKRVEGVPSHMAVDEATRTLYIADTGNARIVAVDADSGRYDRPARDDLGGKYKRWSSAESEFEYSIYGCTKQVENFASESLTQPSGLVLSEHHVVVGNYDTGIVVAFEKGTGRKVSEVATGVVPLMGLAIHEESGRLFYTGGDNEVGFLDVTAPCDAADLASGTPEAPAYPEMACGPPTETTLGLEIEHVIHDCSYLNQTDMCLGEQYGTSRETCSAPNGDPNAFDLDMLLMTGFMCHRCLPVVCKNGGTCNNLWGQGFSCSCPAGFRGDLCEVEDASATATPTSSPTQSPMMATTMAPVIDTAAPTVAPTTAAPTAASATGAPTAAPTTGAPTAAPTEATSAASRGAEAAWLLMLFCFSALVAAILAALL